MGRKFKDGNGAIISEAEAIKLVEAAARKGPLRLVAASDDQGSGGQLSAEEIDASLRGGCAQLRRELAADRTRIASAFGLTRESAWLSREDSIRAVIDLAAAKLGLIPADKSTEGEDGEIDLDDDEIREILAAVAEHAVDTTESVSDTEAAEMIRAGVMKLWDELIAAGASEDQACTAAAAATTRLRGELAELS